MDKGIAIVGSGTFPLMLVQNIVGKETKGHAALLSSRCHASAEAEDVIGRDADCVVARCLLSTGVSPARQQVKVGKMQV